MVVLVVVVITAVSVPVAGIFVHDQPFVEPGGDEFVGRGRRPAGEDLDAMLFHAHLRAAAYAAGEHKVDAGRPQQERPGAGFGLERDDNHPPTHGAVPRVDFNHGEFVRATVMGREP